METTEQDTDGRLPVYRAETPDLASLSLPALKRLVTAKRIQLRLEQEYLRLVKASAETAIIEAAGGDKALGANAEARERALLLALEQDDGYVTALLAVRRTEDSLALAQTDLEIRTDARRDRELEVRDKLATALLAIGARDTAEAADNTGEQLVAAILTGAWFAPGVECKAESLVQDYVTVRAALRAAPSQQAGG